MDPIWRLGPHSWASSTSWMRLWECCSSYLTNTAGVAVLGHRDDNDKKRSLWQVKQSQTEMDLHNAICYHPHLPLSMHNYYYNFLLLLFLRLKLAQLLLDEKVWCATVSPHFCSIAHCHTYNSSGSCTPPSGIPITELVSSWQLL